MSRTKKAPYKVYHSQKKPARKRREEQWEKPEPKHDYKDRYFQWSLIRRHFLQYVGKEYNEMISFLKKRFPEIAQDYFKAFLSAVFEEDGKIFFQQSKRPVEESHSTCFYVHPDTGIVCRHVGIPWEEKTPEKKTIEKDGKTFFLASNGEWYEVTFSEKKKWIYTEVYLPECIFHGVYKELLPGSKSKYIFMGFTNVKSWRQISSKEKKKLNVK